MATAIPTVETTKDFILIKIPRQMFGVPPVPDELLSLERGLRESMQEARAGQLIGPFRTGKSLLRALKKPIR